MIQFFLRAKHWLLFLLMFGIPFVVQLIFMVSVFISLFNLDGEPNVTDITGMKNFFWFMPALMLIAMFGTFGWLWSIGVGLQSKLPQGVRMSVTRFKILMILPIIYFVAFISFIFSMVGLVFESDFGPDFDPSRIAFAFAIIIPFHLGSMICILHTFYFAAKTIKSIELQREASFSDFIGEFFLLWFNIVGVWILQPRINKMVEVESSDQSTLLS